MTFTEARPQSKVEILLTIASLKRTSLEIQAMGVCYWECDV